MGKMDFPSIATQFSKAKQYTTQRHTGVETGLPFARLLPFSTWTLELCYALPLPRAEYSHVTVFDQCRVGKRAGFRSAITF